MKIICVSYNFPPLNDAEALCTARLVSCLAAEGHEVWVVTHDHLRSLDQSIDQELVDKRLKLVRISTKAWTGLRSFLAQARYRVRAAHAHWLTPAIAATRELLILHPGAILMTRSMPVVSNLIGYHCKNLAQLWVAHFSDPYPISVWKHRKRFAPLVFHLHLGWARRIVRHADLVTVTCSNCIRYMEERLEAPFRSKTQIVTHLSLPKLKPGNTVFQRRQEEFWLAHIGNLMEQRNPEVLLEGVARAARRIPELRFLQYGNIDAGVGWNQNGDLNERLSLQNINNLNPRDAADLQAQVDVNVISDTDFGTNYSPLILSKFPHAVCAERPMLMLSLRDSAMGDYTARFGGGLLASFREPAAVESSILQLHSAWKDGKQRFKPSRDLMSQFAAQTILPPFLERIHNLLDMRNPHGSKATVSSRP